ncbi:hypothetical protein HPB50_021846 [Hyalomma asiaticum]|uniref:Uncharacterized protein n=1 Tax=Hyalomma asiaticum TaxID=266040 RepID=A0ACB7TNQ4_HYAAI|nr:hypothetical protein HPB50_021846 [Hyalomma asiaticum]
MGKVSEKPAESDHASNNPVPNPHALLQLKLAFEAEIRFKDAVEAVGAKLSKMQEILDWGNLMGLEEFLRPKKADAEGFTTNFGVGRVNVVDEFSARRIHLGTDDDSLADIVRGGYISLYLTTLRS